MWRSLFFHIFETSGATPLTSLSKPTQSIAMDSPPHQKCTTALRMLAYGSVVDSINVYIIMEKSPILEYLKLFL
jgi:hypothetical protein